LKLALEKQMEQGYKKTGAKKKSFGMVAEFKKKIS